MFRRVVACSLELLDFSFSFPFLCLHSALLDVFAKYIFLNPMGPKVVMEIIGPSWHRGGRIRFGLDPADEGHMTEYSSINSSLKALHVKN